MYIIYIIYVYYLYIYIYIAQTWGFQCFSTRTHHPDWGKGTLVNVSHRAAHGWVYAATVKHGEQASDPPSEGAVVVRGGRWWSVGFTQHPVTPPIQRWMEGAMKGAFGGSIFPTNILYWMGSRLELLRVRGSQPSDIQWLYETSDSFIYSFHT